MKFLIVFLGVQFLSYQAIACKSGDKKISSSEAKSVMKKILRGSSEWLEVTPGTKNEASRPFSANADTSKIFYNGTDASGRAKLCRDKSKNVYIYFLGRKYVVKRENNVVQIGKYSLIPSSNVVRTQSADGQSFRKKKLASQKRLSSEELRQLSLELQKKENRQLRILRSVNQSGPGSVVRDTAGSIDSQGI